MKNKTIKSFLITICIAALIVGLTMAAFFAARNHETREITDFIVQYNREYTEILADKEFADTVEAVTYVESFADRYYSGGFKSAKQDSISAMVSYKINGTKDITKYEKKPIDISVDYSNGFLIVYAEFIVSYNGFGTYVGGIPKTIDFVGKSLEKYILEKNGDTYVIKQIDEEFR